MHETRRNMYKGSSGEGSSLRDIQYVHWDCRKGEAAGAQAAPRQRWCKREVWSCSSEVLLHAGYIYRQLPAESGRDGTRVRGER